MNLRRGFGFEKYSGLYLWAVLIIGFSIWQPEYFPTMLTVRSVAAEQAAVCMLALAALVPIAAGQFDLSVGANANICTMSAVILINGGWDWPKAVAASIVLGGIIGAINGFIVVRWKVSSFITTWGTGSVITAFQIIITDNSQPMPPSDESWSNFTQTLVGGFQIIVVYMLVLAVVVWWVLQRTPFGRYLFAIGSNPEAARLSGTRVGTYTWLSMIMSGLIAGIAGSLYASYAGPSLTYGSALLLPAFAAVFLGSTQIIPGRFNVWGTVLAIFVLATGVKGLQLATDAQWLAPMFSGAALILAVAVALGRQRSAAERTRRRLARADTDVLPGSSSMPLLPGTDGVNAE